MVGKFLHYVEIRTKITSMLTFFWGIMLLIYQKQVIDPEKTILFFFSMLFIDLATTSINNYIDSKGNGQPLSFSPGVSRGIIYGLLIAGSVIGIWLAFRTDLVVLILGMLCVGCGILYTFGPIPISRQPLGEMLSGFFYGVILLFILLYINSPSGTYLSLEYIGGKILLQFLLKDCVVFLGYSVVPFCATANIMLANNLCDLEKDIQVNRYTLPYYLGKEKGLKVFAMLYMACYLVIIPLVFTGNLPWSSLLGMLTFFPVWKNIVRFQKEQEKKETFVYAVQNFIYVVGGHTLAILPGLFF